MLLYSNPSCSAGASPCISGGWGAGPKSDLSCTHSTQGSRGTAWLTVSAERILAIVGNISEHLHHTVLHGVQAVLPLHSEAHGMGSWPAFLRS